ECLNLHWFRSLRHARGDIGGWRYHDNTKRPHSALGHLSPTEFLMKTTAPALETLAVSTLPLNTTNQPENSRSNQPKSRGKVTAKGRPLQRISASDESQQVVQDAALGRYWFNAAAG
ncbi:MAG: integrase core domain-containing protein, partial [Pseudomonadota bacterium]